MDRTLDRIWTAPGPHPVSSSPLYPLPAVQGAVQAPCGPARPLPLRVGCFLFIPPCVEKLLPRGDTGAHSFCSRHVNGALMPIGASRPLMGSG
jgi:hypothetical protein